MSFLFVEMNCGSSEWVSCYDNKLFSNNGRICYDIVCKVDNYRLLEKSDDHEMGKDTNRIGGVMYYFDSDKNIYIQVSRQLATTPLTHWVEFVGSKLLKYYVLEVKKPDGLSTIVLHTFCDYEMISWQQMEIREKLNSIHIDELHMRAREALPGVDRRLPSRKKLKPSQD